MTVEEAKSEYRKLAKLHHPDLGGDLETMQAINSEFEDYLKAAWRQEGHGEETVGNKFNAVAEVMAQAMRFAKVSAALVVEVCGIWIWITGDTKPVKDTLKEEGCRWSNDKKAWYWKPEWCKKRSRDTFSLDRIRGTFGSQQVNGNEQWVA